MDERALARACARGEEEAIRTFVGLYRKDVRDSLARFVPSKSGIDELEQRVWVKLLVAEPGETPKVIAFAGHGSLAGWVRSIAAHLAVDELRRERKMDRGLGDLILEAGADPEIEYLKRVYAAEVRECIGKALEGLTERVRGVLRDYYFGNLGIDELAAKWGMHRATAARQVIAARDEVLTATRALLGERFAIDAIRVESILRLVGSHLELPV